MEALTPTGKEMYEEFTLAYSSRRRRHPSECRITSGSLECSIDQSCIISFSPSAYDLSADYFNKVLLYHSSDNDRHYYESPIDHHFFSIPNYRPAPPFWFRFE